ncbi:hypothetical protein DN068_07480 [Taibaiella soli]|uniref:Uncharacterized protein n=1 Tax=Taibaiella soli TaxID=1649169 RepID=A0A2W2B0Q3_9BACT|nr:hypothetical protein DN068_07480 [Taibaiella soli]
MYADIQSKRDEMNNFSFHKVLLQRLTAFITRAISKKIEKGFAILESCTIFAIPTTGNKFLKHMRK